MPSTFPLNVPQLLSVLNHLNLGVYITDLDRRIVLWSRKAEELTGHKAADVVGRTCHDQVLNHIDKDGHALCSGELCPLHRAITTNAESAQPVLVFARRANGTRIAVSVSVAPLRDPDGQVIGGIEAFRDETAQVRDMEFARTVQRRLLPAELPATGEIAFDVCYYPHDLVGGDFYDVQPVGPQSYGVFIADVSGHGVSAALYTMWLKSLKEGLKPVAHQPAVFMTELNRELSKYIVDESFATAFYAVVDAGGQITYTNAGHPAPLHWRAAERTVGKLETHGLPLAVSATEEYPSSSFTLRPDDLLLGYTDGVTEVNMPDGRQVGTDGLSEILARQIALRPARLLEQVYQRILARCAAVSLPDDVLLLSIARRRAG